MKQYWTAHVALFVAIVIIVRVGLHGEIASRSLIICGSGLALATCLLLHLCTKVVKRKNKNERS